MPWQRSFGLQVVNCASTISAGFGGVHFRGVMCDDDSMPAGKAAAVLAAAAIALSGCGDGGGGSNGGSSSKAMMTGYQIVTGGTASLGNQGASTVSAACPTGKVVTGGGYTTMNYAANVFESFPMSDGSAWTVSAKNENIVSTGAGSIVVTPFAICVNKPVGYDVRTGSIELRHQQVADGEARCQDATYAMLGGGISGGDSMIHAFANKATSNAQPTWASSFKSNYPAVVPSSSSGKTFVICAGLREAPGRAEATSTPTVLGTQSNATLTVSCPSGTKVLSGGFSSAESPAIWFDSSPSSDGTMWNASLRNPQTIVDPVTVNATISVVCAKTD